MQFMEYFYTLVCGLIGLLLGLMTCNAIAVTFCQQAPAPAASSSSSSTQITHHTSTDQTMFSSSTSTSDDADISCANCGKEEAGENKLKTCNACKLVKYCCRECQVAHRPQHKKACKKRATELFEEELFKDPPDCEECPICMLPQPLRNDQAMFQSCCGKTICCGCIHAQVKEDIKSGKREEEIGACPFCRKPDVRTDEEANKRLKHMLERNNARALHIAASYYMNGERGFRRDSNMAIELYLKSGELGCADAYFALGNIYEEGRVVKRDTKKARHYWEHAVIGGSTIARHNLGIADLENWNYERAYRHFVVSGKGGFEPSLTCVREGFEEGHITKDEYAEVLRAYQKLQDDRKSAMRNEALVYEANPRLYWEK